jgi:hypothetical protein
LHGDNLKRFNPGPSFLRVTSCPSWFVFPAVYQLAIQSL